MPNKALTDILTQTNIRDYIRAIPQKPMLGATLLPNSADKIYDMQIGYLLGANSTPIAASITAFDAETPLYSPSAVRKVEIELLKFAKKMRMSERLIRALEAPRNDTEFQRIKTEVFNYSAQCVSGVAARIEAARWEALYTGKLVFANENSINSELDYDAPTDMFFDLDATTDTWDLPGANPIEDMEAWANYALARNGERPTRAVTSSAVLMTLLKNESIRKMAWGLNADRILTQGDLNTLMQSMGLPTIITYDELYMIEGRDGKRSRQRYLPQSAFIMLPSAAIGETVYGITAEEIAASRLPNVQFSEQDKIIAMTYEQGPDPVSRWMKACTIAIPSLPMLEFVVRAKVLPDSFTLPGVPPIDQVPDKFAPDVAID